MGPSPCHLYEEILMSYIKKNKEVTTNGLENSGARYRAVSCHMSSTIPSSPPYASCSSHSPLLCRRRFRFSIVASVFPLYRFFSSSWGVPTVLQHRPVSRHCPRLVPSDILRTVPSTELPLSLSLFAKSTYRYRLATKCVDLLYSFEGSLKIVGPTAAGQRSLLASFREVVRKKPFSGRGTVSTCTDHAKVHCSFLSY